MGDTDRTEDDDTVAGPAELQLMTTAADARLWRGRFRSMRRDFNMAMVQGAACWTVFLADALSDASYWKALLFAATATSFGIWAWVVNRVDA